MLYRAAVGPLSRSLSDSPSPGTDTGRRIRMLWHTAGRGQQHVQRGQLYVSVKVGVAPDVAQAVGQLHNCNSGREAGPERGSHARAGRSCGVSMRRHP